MSDRHVRILRAVAKHRQDQADRDPTPAAGRAGRSRRLNLKRIAARTRARVSAAEARRSRPSGD
jgi:hypothetical protein